MSITRAAEIDLHHGSLPSLHFSFICEASSDDKDVCRLQPRTKFVKLGLLPTDAGLSQPPGLYSAPHPLYK